MTDEQRKAYIQGVLAERQAYAVSGDVDNVLHCDEELKRVGYEAKAPAKRAQTRKR